VADVTLLGDIEDVAAGRYDAAERTPEERLFLISMLCDRDRERRNARRERRYAHARGFLISAALVGQGLTDLHMWARV
jgi:hypothetical protein